MINQYIAIIITAYNVEKYIERCIHSIQQQTYSNWKIYIVDDGSKDNTLAIVKRMAKSDNRIIVKHTENQGTIAARKTGIAVFKGNAWANTMKPMAGACLCTGLCGIFQKIILNNRIIMWLGKRSMFFYIVHIAVWDFLTSIISMNVLYFGISIGVSLFLTEVIYIVTSVVITFLKNAVNKVTKSYYLKTRD